MMPLKLYSFIQGQNPVTCFVIHELRYMYLLSRLLLNVALCNEQNEGMKSVQYELNRCISSYLLHRFYPLSHSYSQFFARGLVQAFSFPTQTHPLEGCKQGSELLMIPEKNCKSNSELNSLLHFKR